MDSLNEYQQEVKKLCFYPNHGTDIIYPTLGLCGESGEVAEKVKKCIRDTGGNFALVKDDLVKELGDVLFYLAAIALELRVDFSEVAKQNIEKLKSRNARGMQRGSGDNR